MPFKSFLFPPLFSHNKACLSFFFHSIKLWKQVFLSVHRCVCYLWGPVFSMCLAVSWLGSSGSGGHHQLLAGLLRKLVRTERFCRYMCSLLYIGGSQPGIRPHHRLGATGQQSVGILTVGVQGLQFGISIQLVLHGSRALPLLVMCCPWQSSSPALLYRGRAELPPLLHLVACVAAGGAHSVGWANGELIMGGGNGDVFIIYLLLVHLSARRGEKLSCVFWEQEGRLLLQTSMFWDGSFPLHQQTFCMSQRANIIKIEWRAGRGMKMVVWQHNINSHHNVAFLVFERWRCVDRSGVEGGVRAGSLE